MTKHIVKTEQTFVFDAETALKAATLAVIGLTSAWNYKLQETDKKEIIAEAVAKAWSHRDSYNPSKAAFQTWVWSIARNTLLNHISRSYSAHKKDAHSLENEVTIEKSPDIMLIEDESLETIMRAVQRLSETYRNIILLLLEGKQSKEIAEVLRCSANAAAIRCFRARKALRKLLEGNL